MSAKFTFIQNATATVNTVGGATATYTDANNGGDLLIAFMAGLSASADFPTPPDHIVDTAGNTYKLAFFSPDQSTAAEPIPAFAIFVCDSSTVTSPGNQVSSPFTWSEIADVTQLTVYLYEYKTMFPNIALDTSQVTAFGPGGGIVNLDQSGDDDLVFGYGFATQADGTVLLTYTNENQIVGNFEFFGWREASNALETDDIAVDVTYTGATSASVIVVAFLGTNNTGASAQGSATLRMFPGPKPIVPLEHRAMAMVQIDCTQLQVRALPCNYPELTTSNSSEFQGFTLVELDLEHITQGSGLTSVHHIHAYSRPDYSGDDFGEIVRSFPAFLTNVSTLQTYMLGANACEIVANGTGFEHQVLPFSVSKNALKFRVIVPQSALNAPVGKFTIIFFNYDLQGAAQEWCTLEGE